ncbi:unnamed protein product [Citrullus colocynthis]|uniref:Uncharacterized protein n=1 Tax=Citrullus colocynthis TaxID=252529 RepID=A0ABP0Y1N2_9ROSI
MHQYPHRLLETKDCFRTILNSLPFSFYCWRRNLILKNHYRTQFVFSDRNNYIHLILFSLYHREIGKNGFQVHRWIEMDISARAVQRIDEFRSQYMDPTVHIYSSAANFNYEKNGITLLENKQ